MSIENSDMQLKQKPNEDPEILFPHLKNNNTNNPKYPTKPEKTHDNITFIYTTKFSNLCDTPYPKPHPPKPKTSKQSHPFHSQKRSCRLPGPPTFEDFFGEKESHTSRYMAPHLRKRLNAIIVRKTETTSPNSNIPANNHIYNNTTTTKVNEMQTFLGKHFPFNKTNQLHIKQYNDNKDNMKMFSKLKSPKTKCKYIQEINPHVNMYDDIRLLDKSTSCQRIDHLNRLINMQFKHNNTQHNRYLYTSNNKCNSVNDLFYVSREKRIKNKIHDLSKFTIFPDYNLRKIDIDLKRQYAKNNLNIIGGIKDQFEENKKIEIKEKLDQYNNDISHHSHEIDEDIDIDNLL